MSYIIIKHIHLTSIVISLLLFTFRGFLMCRDSEALSKKWLRISPHIVDTVLLISAAMLAWKIQQYPFIDSWLTAKILALVAYIALGSIALKSKRSKKIKVTAFALSLIVVSYILMVATHHNPWPF